MRATLAAGRLVTRLATAIPLDFLPPGALGGVEPCPLDLAHLDELPAPLAAVLFDGDAASAEELEAACKSARLETVPKLVVSCRHDVHELAARLGADLWIAGPLEALDRRDLVRRLLTLCELGSLRVFVGVLQQSFEDGVTGFSVADADGDQPIRAVSPAFERVTGYTQEEVVGRNCRFLRGSDPGDPEGRQEFRRELALHRRAKMLVRNYKKDGTTFWNELTVFRFRAQGVDLPLLGGVQHDVTELVEARLAVDELTRALLQRQAFDHAVLDGVDLGIVTTDGAERVTYANRAAREFLAIEEQDVSTLDVRQALGLEKCLHELAGSTSSHALESGGVEREIEVTVSRAESAQGALDLLLVLRDATDERKMQRELRRVEHLAAMGTMVAGFAHEVRNPVASLRTMAESLEEDLAEAGVGLPHVQRMLQVLARIERLVSTSLQFGRPASPRLAAHRPWAIVSAALSTIAGRTGSGTSELRVEIEPDLPDVCVDEGQMVQVLVTLLNNAFDAAGAPSRVMVRVGFPADHAPGSQPKTQPPPGAVRFEVIDDGPGITPEVEARMFDPFFTTKPTGTGLGLSIAQQLVSENGGRIELLSAREPTIFAVECPIVTA